MRQRGTQSYFGGPDVGPAGVLLRAALGARPEGDGYLIGVAQRLLEGRSELLILDAQRLAEGPLATVRMPFRIFARSTAGGCRRRNDPAST